MQLVKIIRVIGLIIIFFLVYFIYRYYKNNSLENEHYAGAAEERVYTMSLISLDKRQNRPNHYNKVLLSTIMFDLQVIDKYDDIKKAFKLKRYCKMLKDIEKELYDYNKTSKEIINKVCKDIRKKGKK